MGPFAVRTEAQGSLKVKWSAVRGLAGHMPSHLTSPLPQHLPLCRSAPAPVCCQGGWTLLQEGAVVAWARAGGGGGAAAISEGPVTMATLASLQEFGEKSPGETTDGGQRGRVIPRRGCLSGTCLPGSVEGEAEVPPCPALSHGHPPGSPPKLPQPCSL